MVKDVLIQMLRNAVVHGIEPADVRRAQSKDEMGVVRFDFRRQGEEFELRLRGRRRGPRAGSAAKRRGEQGARDGEEAAALDYRGLMALIFKPGFSTPEQVTMDAGRGIGMDVVARSVYARAAGSASRPASASSRGSRSRCRRSAAANTAVA